MLSRHLYPVKIRAKRRVAENRNLALDTIS
jgi:hypothetical protein